MTPTPADTLSRTTAAITEGAGLRLRSHGLLWSWDFDVMISTNLMMLNPLPQVSAGVSGTQSKGEGPLAGLLPEVPRLHAAVSGLFPPPCSGLACDHTR